MKKVNIYNLLGAFLIMSSSYAQKKLNLSLKYDTDFDRYEVYVKPNFSQRNFTWGPSQISIVLPSNVMIEKINVKNIDGGAWEDNSVIQAPEVVFDKSFHGISTSGDKTNLIEGYESVLFYFTLPVKVNPNQIRIFDNKTDPNSSNKGMMGGDFRNTIVDISGNDLFNEVYLQEKRTVAEVEEKAGFNAVVFPNVIVDNKFSISLDGITEKDGNVLMIVADGSGKEILRQKGSKSLIEKQVYSLPNKHSIEGLIVKIITSKGSVSKRLVVE